jgi:hypothetical protein
MTGDVLTDQGMQTQGNLLEELGEAGDWKLSRCYQLEVMVRAGEGRESQGEREVNHKREPRRGGDLDPEGTIGGKGREWRKGEGWCREEGGERASILCHK